MCNLFKMTGIGRAVALKLVEAGANLIAVSRTQSDLDSLKQEVSISFCIALSRPVFCFSNIAL